MSKFSSHYNQKKYSDVVIQIHETKIYAHQVILRQHSPVITAMLDNEMSERKDAIIDFSHHPVDAVICVIKHMYGLVDTVDIHVINFAKFLIVDTCDLMKRYIGDDYYMVVASVAGDNRDLWKIVLSGFSMGKVNILDMELDVFLKFYEHVISRSLKSKYIILVFNYADSHPEFNIMNYLGDVDFTGYKSSTIQEIAKSNVIKNNKLVQSLLNSIYQHARN